MIKKICPKCNEYKNKDQFNKNKSKKDGLQVNCKLCQSECTKKHYRNNKSAYLDRSKKQKIKLIEWYKNYKNSLSCEKCGEDHISCLQFHHIDKNDKRFNISYGASVAFSINKILEEIEKCIVLCANCHFKLHYMEKGAGD